MGPFLVAALTLMSIPAGGAAAATLPEVDVELRGSPESMVRQHQVAVEGGYTFVRTLDEMERLAARGELVPIRGGPNYEVADWVFPYGLPEVRTFVERLAEQYRAACGERLVVTSLTRPFSEQPPNAHELSVHPAGMAVDLRISQVQACRQFIEDTLLAKEAEGLLDITRERAPPHYHIAIFPNRYGPYAEQRIAAEAPPPEPAAPAVPDEEVGGPVRVAAATLVILLLGTGVALLVLTVRGRSPRDEGEERS